MPVIYRAQLQSQDAVNIAAGILMKLQRYLQQNWSRFLSRPLLGNLTDPTTNLSKPSKEAYKKGQLKCITVNQQKLLTAMGIKHIEDKNWMPLAYTQVKL